MSPRGGKREGSGRKVRSEPKSKGVWLGQITDEQRDFIIQWLSPDERFGALWAAANIASTGLAASGSQSEDNSKAASR